MREYEQRNKQILLQKAEIDRETKIEKYKRDLAK